MKIPRARSPLRATTDLTSISSSPFRVQAMAVASPAPPRRTRRPRPAVHPPLWRRGRRILLVASLFCLALAALSGVPAVPGSRNLGITVSSVEWLRSHGGNPIVSQIENWYYTLNEPEKGGPAVTWRPKAG